MLREPGRIMLTADAVGGVWRYCLELAAGFAGRGVRVLLATLGPEPDVAQRAEVAAIDGCDLSITGLPLDWTADCAATLRRGAKELAIIAAAWGADTVQLHTPALVPSASWHAPVVAVVHSCVGTWWRAVRGGALPDDLAWRAATVAEGLTAADAVLAPSRSLAASLTDTYGLTRPIQVVPNGRHAMEVERAPRPHALTVGRLWDEGKNVAALDEAATRSGVHVLAAGPVVGPNGATLASGHLRLLGTLGPAELAREYARAAVFVSPALYEPFGLAVLEAAQARCALLLSGIPSFRELWDGAALFVDPRDSARLAAALQAMIHAPDWCARLGTAAARRATRFSAEAMIERTWEVHCAVLAGRGLAPAA